MTKSQSTTTSLRDQLDLIEVKPGTKFSKAVLTDMLDTTEAVLFFGKVYELDYTQLSAVMHLCCKSDVAEALFAGDHSTDLQGYLVTGYEDEDGNWHDGIGSVVEGDVTFDPDIPAGEILPEVYEMLEVEVAKSIKTVAAKLENVVSLLPSKQGKMLFQSMLRLNKQRPTLGVHAAGIQHERQQQNLLILDVSGSMTEDTVRKIIDDVVALSYNANAHMAIVSETCFYWEPGTYSVDDVLEKAEYWGTHYEKLAPLFDRDWGTVITVADYDSSQDAARVIGKCTGHIDEVIDVSLVDRPTYLAEVVGQLADKVTPILIGRSRYVLESDYERRYGGFTDADYDDEYDD